MRLTLLKIVCITSSMGVNIFFLALYIDDIMLATDDICLLHDTKIFLSNLFEMKDLGDASFVLGI